MREGERKTESRDDREKEKQLLRLMCCVCNEIHRRKHGIEMRDLRVISESEKPE
jgi:ribosomal protein L44E